MWKKYCKYINYGLIVAIVILMSNILFYERIESGINYSLRFAIYSLYMFMLFGFLLGSWRIKSWFKKKNELDLKILIVSLILFSLILYPYYVQIPSILNIMFVGSYYIEIFGSIAVGYLLTMVINSK